MDRIYKIFVINPGSTSSKLSVYENEQDAITEDIFHDAPVLATILTMVYAAIWGVFIYMMYQLYKR